MSRNSLVIRWQFFPSRIVSNLQLCLVIALTVLHEMTLLAQRMLGGGEGDQHRERFDGRWRCSQHFWEYCSNDLFIFVHGDACHCQHHNHYQLKRVGNRISFCKEEEEGNG